MDGLRTLFGERKWNSFEREWKDVEKEWGVDVVPSLKISKPYSDSLDAERCSSVGEIDSEDDIDSDDDSYVSYLSDDAFEDKVR